MTGNEKFYSNGNNLQMDVLSYWKWSSSDLLTNRQRGILAEYIVASALNLTSKPREEWDAYDLVTNSGLKIEVKSSAYVQSWKQEKASTISFGIKPTLTWDNNDKRTTDKIRQADVYVFCVLAHKDENTIDPLNLDQWNFYILETNVLNEKIPEQKKITLSSLLKLNPIKLKYHEIAKTIKGIL